MIFWILSSILVTSFISGVLGMAGGMILIGVLSLLLPITSAMILHGVTQLCSNAFRAFLSREHIKLKVLPTYLLGAFIGFLLISILNFVPSKSFVLIAVGVFPFLGIRCILYKKHFEST